MKQNRPFFSIVIPTYNRPGQLAACLGSLARLDYPRDQFEVLVVDDGSKISVKGVLDPFRDRFEVNLLTLTHGGPALARNAGAAQAKGDFLAFTDDDCAPSSDWLEKLETRFNQTPDHAIGGPMINTISDSAYAAASQLLLNYLYAYYDGGPGCARFLTASNMAFPAGRFRALGGFDITFPLAAGEDREFCDRWRHHGHPLTYAPEVRVHHSHPLTFGTFWRQHFNYGRGAFHFHRVRAHRTRKGIQIEPLSFYLNLLRYPLTQSANHPAWLAAALLTLSQGANAAGFFWEKLKFLNDSHSESQL